MSSTLETLTGRDTHSLEIKGVFNTLVRLHDAMLSRNSLEIERLIGILDEDFDRLVFARAELGARQQTLDAIDQRLQIENVELQSALSDRIDVDLVEAIFNLTARQTAFEATLQVIVQTSHLSLIDFLKKRISCSNWQNPADKPYRSNCFIRRM